LFGKETKIKKCGVTIMFGIYKIGQRVKVSDGSKRPPERFNRKLIAWKANNYEGVISDLRPEDVQENYTIPPQFEIEWGSSSMMTMVKCYPFPLPASVIVEVLEA